MIMIRDDDMYQAFIECRKLGATARVHAENGDVIWEKQQELLKLGITGPEGHTQSRPEELEAEATNRACVLAGQANCPLYVVHVTTKGAAETIALHRLKGTIVIGEATAAALSIDGHNLYHSCWLHAASHVSSPPLSQDPTTPAYLMDLFACGQLQLTGSDNCTYSTEQRKIGKGDFTKIPNGVNGLEDRMSIVWEKGVHSGKLDPMRFVAITSTAAAKIFNIYPKKGRIAVGSDADIVVWDPRATRTISAKTHHQAVDFNIFEGMEVHGVPLCTITRGVVAWENGELKAVKGSGRFVPLPTHSPAVFGSNEQRSIMLAPRKVKRDDD
uniref:dihydropyrimidinase n=1 Tax=Plectus sambesii TaxID=2011161 RepID=A0A914X952_9BILA